MEDAQRPAAHVGASASLEKVLRSLHNTMPDDWREQYRSWLHRDSFAHPNTSAGKPSPGFRDLPDLPATHGHGSPPSFSRGTISRMGTGVTTKELVVSLSFEVQVLSPAKHERTTGARSGNFVTRDRLGTLVFDMRHVAGYGSP